MQTTKPIDIPKNKIFKMRINSSVSSMIQYQCPCSTPKSASFPPKNKNKIPLSTSYTSIINFKVILGGGPYKNIDTMIQIVSSSVPELDIEKVKELVNEAHSSQSHSAILLSCSKTKAEKYCINLIENGLIACIE